MQGSTEQNYLKTQMGRKAFVWTFQVTNKLVQKEYKSRHDCVGKVIQREQCKISKFDHKNIIRPREWYAQTSLGFWHTNWSPNVDRVTRPSDIQQKKENLPNSGLCISVNHQVKIKKKSFLDLVRKLKNMEHEGDGDTNCNWCTWNNLRKIV